MKVFQLMLLPRDLVWLFKVSLEPSLLFGDVESCEKLKALYLQILLTNGVRRIWGFWWWF